MILMHYMSVIICSLLVVYLFCFECKFDLVSGGLLWRVSPSLKSQLCRVSLSAAKSLYSADAFVGVQRHLYPWLWVRLAPAETSALAPWQSKTTKCQHFMALHGVVSSLVHYFLKQVVPQEQCLQAMFVERISVNLESWHFQAPPSTTCAPKSWLITGLLKGINQKCIGNSCAWLMLGTSITKHRHIFGMPILDTQWLLHALGKTPSQKSTAWHRTLHRTCQTDQCSKDRGRVKVCKGDVLTDTLWFSCSDGPGTLAKSAFLAMVACYYSVSMLLVLSGFYWFCNLHQIREFVGMCAHRQTLPLLCHVHLRVVSFWQPGDGPTSRVGCRSSYAAIGSHPSCPDHCKDVATGAAGHTNLTNKSFLDTASFELTSTSVTVALSLRT